MIAATHPIIDLLCRAGLSRANGFVRISERVRDREDVFALRCRQSGVIVLDRIDHITTGVYEDRGDLSYWGSADRQQLLKATFADDSRRERMLRPYATGKTCLDVGTGLGGVLDLVRPHVAHVDAVEPQAGIRQILSGMGYRVFGSLDDVTDRYDVMSAFHVYEHVPDQIGFLETAKSRIAPDGTLILEVPHANDALIRLYKNEAFLNFTLWSQHLILHTRDSLRRFLTMAGYRDVRIVGVQRYPLANHLYWLMRKKPGGHQTWSFLNGRLIDGAYEAMLKAVNGTDTLIAIAKP